MKYLCDDFWIFWIVGLCVDQLSSDWQTQPWCFSILSEETTSRETTSSKKWDKKFLCQEDRMDRHIGFNLLSFRCVCIEPQPTGARRRSPQAALAKMWNQLKSVLFSFCFLTFTAVPFFLEIRRWVTHRYRFRRLQRWRWRRWWRQRLWCESYAWRFGACASACQACQFAWFLSHNSNWRLTPLTLLPGRQYNQNKSVAQVRWTVWAERNGEWDVKIGKG